MRAPASHPRPYWSRWRSGWGRWTCPCRRWRNGNGSTGSSRGPCVRARRSTHAGRSRRSARRSAARPPRSWCGGWTSTPLTEPCALKVRSGRACAARPRRLGREPAKAPLPRPRPPHAGAAAAAPRPPRRRPKLLRRQSKHRQPHRLKKPAPPGGGEGAARGRALRPAPTASLRPRLTAPRPSRLPRRPGRRPQPFHPPGRSAESSSDCAGPDAAALQSGGSRASMYSMTRRVSCEGVEAPLVTPTFLAPFSQPVSRSSSRSTR